MSKVVLIDYGAGNVKSVMFALERIGVTPILTDDPEQIKNADKVVFPGVGEASFAMNQLKEKGLDTLIQSLKQPVLGICLGMQIMCTSSEEGDTDCLGIFDLQVKEFTDVPKIPHMGWNTLNNLKSDLFKGIPEESFVYFVHSFYVPQSSYSIANCTYDNLTFTAAIQKDNFYACQFHPEKSSELGAQILKNFIEL